MSENDWHSQETYKSLMLFGNNAVKFVLLVNGGAIIALLTFLGNFLKNNQVTVDMAWPMGCFLLGIVVGGFANITAYLTQLALYNEGIGNELDRNHTTWLNWSLVLVCIGILLFGVGSVLALLEIRTYSITSA